MDEGEFAEFFRDFYPRLVRFAAREVDVATAHDLASTTLTALWSKALPVTLPQERGPLEALGYRILRGKLANTRRASRRQLALLTRLRSRYEPESVMPAEAGPDLPLWFQTLRPRDREIILLTVDGYGVDEIASILGCSAAAAKKRLLRARERARFSFHRDGHLRIGVDPEPSLTRWEAIDG